MLLYAYSRTYSNQENLLPLFLLSNTGPRIISLSHGAQSLYNRFHRLTTKPIDIYLKINHVGLMKTVLTISNEDKLLSDAGLNKYRLIQFFNEIICVLNFL